MYCKIKSLSFKNVNAYGNSKTHIDFTSGLNLISGSNGQGKSTILDALCFCLFGCPYRKIKIKELVNRTNKRNLWTRVYLEDGKDEYIITRTLKKSTLSIEKNGSPLHLLSTKKLTQEEIDKILGVDITLFRQIISLAVNYNKPFLSLKVGEKRDIIETIFNIKVFGEMLKAIKVQNSNDKSEYELTRRTVKILEDNLKETDKQIKDIINTKAHFDTDKKKELNDLKQKAETLQTKISKCKENISLGETKLDKYTNKTYGDLYENKENINKEIGMNDYKINKATKDLLFFEDNDSCPVCETDIGGDHKTNHLERITEKKVAAENEILRLNKELAVVQKNIQKKDKNEKLITEIDNAINSEKNKVKFYNTQLVDYNDRTTTVEQKSFDIDIDKIKKSFKHKKKEYRDNFNITKKLSKDIKCNDVITGILSDQGIKSHFFRKLVPILNSKVNEYLDKFEMPIKLTFNEYMEENITSFSGKHKDLAYMSFSEGEKKRIDISILLSFIETTKVISNWSCNILLLDEILDTSLDDSGFDSIIENLKTLIYDDKDLCIYVISHKASPSNFTNILSIKKENGFSKIGH